MKEILTVLTIVFCTVAVASAQRTGNKGSRTDNAEQEIKQLMSEIDEAHRQSNAAAFDRIWADDYVLTDWRGSVKNRAEALAEWKGGEHKYESYQSDEIKVRVYGDTAVVTARVTRKSRSDAENMGQFRHTRVFVKQQGRWRLVATQVTRIAQQATPTVVYSQNPEANELFLKAREYLTKGNPRIGGSLATTREAIRLFEQAVEKDPKFALAYVEISRAWMQLAYSVPGGVTNKEALPHAKAAALKAVALDENLAAAHLALASIHFDFEHDWGKTEREYELVLRLSPNDAAAHSSYATYLGAMGRFAKALAEAERAEELKPSATTEYTLARIHYWMRRYDEAAGYCRRSLKKEEMGVSHFLLGFVYVAKSKPDEAIPELKRSVSMLSNNGGALASLAYAYAMDGKKGEALRIVGELRVRQKRNEAEIVPYRVAAVYVALGDKDRAIEWLRKDYQRSGRWMNNLKVDPVMDPLRSDLRFQELMRKMNFKE